MSTEFTFHYVSILMKIPYWLYTFLKPIYIPLCLYFNDYTNPSLNSLFLFTFHYVSILITTRYSIWYFCTFIYIPLCLYFNPSSPSLFIFFLFHPLSVDLSIAINILPYFSCFFYKIDGKCPIYRVF